MNPVAPEGESDTTDYGPDIYFASRAGTIFSGLSQIPPDVIGEHAFGRPRESSVAT